MIKTNVQILRELRIFFDEAVVNKTEYTTYAGAFTKPKKLTFTLVVVFLLNLPKRSLAIELEDMYKQFMPGELPCTKSAFSQARYKLKHQFFIDLNKELKHSFYSNNDERIMKWGDYKLEGVDGTTVYLMDTEEIREEYGTHSNQFDSFPIARVVSRVDVLNDFIIAAEIASIKKGEPPLAIKQLSEVPDDVISIYDRNFASFEFIYEHLTRNLHFVIRAKLGFNKVVKAFVASSESSSIVRFNASKNAIKNLKEKGIELTTKDSLRVRLVRVELDNGTIEVLITSLLDEEAFPTEDFKIIYNYRWGTETSFDKLKNKLQLGEFSGHSPEAVRQDFYASIFVANLNMILVEYCQEELEEKAKTREKDYAINRNISIGLMKNEIVKLLIFDEEQISSLLEGLKASFLRYLEPVRPGRNFVRKYKHKARRCKFRTLTNYKRAI